MASVGEKDSTLRATIRASGNFLQVCVCVRERGYVYSSRCHLPHPPPHLPLKVVGCLYLLMQVTCCRRIKAGLVTELRQVKLEL